MGVVEDAHTPLDFVTPSSSGGGASCARSSLSIANLQRCYSTKIDETQGWKTRLLSMARSSPRISNEILLDNYFAK